MSITSVRGFAWAEDVKILSRAQDSGTGKRKDAFVQYLPAGEVLVRRPGLARVFVTFPRRADIPDGLETVEISSDLETWPAADAGTITRKDNGPGRPDTVMARLRRTGASNFVRLKLAF